MKAHNANAKADIISIPAIEITAEAYEDEESGRTTFFPKVRAHADGYSLGMLALRSFEDLAELRRAIDQFVTTNNIEIEMKKTDKETKEAPAYAGVIEGYLYANGYRPMNRGNFNPKHMTILSSQEIIIDLADMVDLGLNDVAAAMLHLGYCTTAHEGKVGWLLGRSAEAE